LYCGVAEIVLQTEQDFCSSVFFRLAGQKKISGEHGPAPAAGGGRCHMDLITIAVVSLIVVSYVVGSLTSSVDIEQKLPHRY